MRRSVAASLRSASKSVSQFLPAASRKYSKLPPTSFATVTYFGCANIRENSVPTAFKLWLGPKRKLIIYFAEKDDVLPAHWLAELTERCVLARLSGPIWQAVMVTRKMIAALPQLAALATNRCLEVRFRWRHDPKQESRPEGRLSQKPLKIRGLSWLRG
jgi:hypothetical protein